MDLNWNAMSLASRTQHLELFLGCKVENASYRGKFYSGIIRRIHPSRRRIFLETDQPKCCFIDVVYNYPDIFSQALIDGLTLDEFLAIVTKYSRPQMSRNINDIPTESMRKNDNRSAELEEFYDWPDLTSSELTGSSVEILDFPGSKTASPKMHQNILQQKHDGMIAVIEYDDIVQLACENGSAGPIDWIKLREKMFLDSAENWRDNDCSNDDDVDQSFTETFKTGETSGIPELGLGSAEEDVIWIDRSHPSLQTFPMEAFVTEKRILKPEVVVMQSGGISDRIGESRPDTVRISSPETMSEPKWCAYGSYPASREKDSASTFEIPTFSDNKEKPNTLFGTLLNAVPPREQEFTADMQVPSPFPQFFPATRHHQCPICGSSGYLIRLYGALTCMPCNNFFRRAVKREKVQRCSKTNSCVIASESLHECCAECRLAKCLKSGMQKADVLTNYRNHGTAPPTSDPTLTTSISGTDSKTEVVQISTACIQRPSTSSKMEKDRSSVSLSSEEVDVTTAACESTNPRNVETRLRSDDVWKFTQSRLPACDLINALSSAELDVFLVSNDGVRHSAHKLILGARSPTLKMFFESGGQEFLMDYPAEMVEAFLQLIYARPCPNLAKNVVELVEMFGKFKVNGEMMEMAERGQVEEAITTENAAYFFFNALKHGQFFIWERAMKIIREEPDIRETEEFRKLEIGGLNLNAAALDFFFDNDEL